MGGVRHHGAPSGVHGKVLAETRIHDFHIGGNASAGNVSIDRAFYPPEVSPRPDCELAGIPLVEDSVDKQPAEHHQHSLNIIFCLVCVRRRAEQAAALKPVAVDAVIGVVGELAVVGGIIQELQQQLHDGRLESLPEFLDPVVQRPNVEDHRHQQEKYQEAQVEHRKSYADGHDQDQRKENSPD